MTARRTETVKVSEFFNDLELNEDVSDLQLLVEAERRGLLDDTCKVVLTEARKRGWVAPRSDIETPVRYEARYLGSSKISDTEELPDSDEVASALTRLMSNPRQNFQLYLDLTIGMDGIMAEDPLGGNEQPRERTSTLRKIKDATLNVLRKNSTVTKPERDLKAEPLLVAKHALREIRTFMIFDKVITFIVQEKDYLTSKPVTNCHAYKCKDHKRAEEIGAELRRKSLAMKHQKQHVRSAQNFPTYEVSLKKSAAGFGLGVIGPATKTEVSSGIFISSITPGSPAASHDEIQVGMQVLSINGTSLEESTMAECRSLMMSAGDRIHIEIRENPYDYAMYQKKLGNLNPIVKFHGTRTTDELDEIVADILEDMLLLSKNKNFSESVRIVGGKAQIHF